MRGRLMSFYAMAFLGTAPFGSLLAGTLAARVGAPMTIALGGVVSVAAAAWFYGQLPAWQEGVRPIYERLGIIPRMASEMREAARRMEPVEE
jgi:hypothetical protein